MPFENLLADWVSITESDIAAVPNPGGTGGAAPAFTTNFDFANVLEPDGVTMGVNNQVTRTSTGFDLGGVSDGTVGYDRMHRVFPTSTFGGGLGDFKIEWEYAYWDGMARGTAYPLIVLTNDTAASYYDGAGKTSPPAPARTAATGTQDSEWCVLVDDSAGLWFGNDGLIAVQDISNGTMPFDLVAGGVPARVDGTFYFCELLWNDTLKTLAYSEYTDATRATLVATVDVTAEIIATSTFTTIMAVTNENQIKTKFSGRDQSSQLRNLNLNLIKGAQATINVTTNAVVAAVAATVVAPVTRYYTTSLYNSDGTLLTAPTTVGVLDKATGVHSVLVTALHPVGHPTHAGLGGWISYSKTALTADQVGAFFYVADSATTAGLESGFSVEMLPQLTNDGNG